MFICIKKHSKPVVVCVRYGDLVSDWGCRKSDGPCVEKSNGPCVEKSDGPCAGLAGSAGIKGNLQALHYYRSAPLQTPLICWHGNANEGTLWPRRPQSQTLQLPLVFLLPRRIVHPCRPRLLLRHLMMLVVDGLVVV